MADSAVSADGPVAPGAASAELEHQLDESLRLAREQLARIRANLALVVGFLTRPEP